MFCGDAIDKLSSRPLGDPLMSTAIGLRFAKCVARLTAWTIFAGTLAWGQQVPEQLYSEMKWRMIGPFRAGKVNAVAGVPGSPGIYYFGANRSEERRVGKECFVPC